MPKTPFIGRLLIVCAKLHASESIHDFSARYDRALKDDVLIADVCGNDAEQMKYFECRWWCMRLARARKAHFAESDARRIVLANLRDLLGHCGDVDASVRASADHLVRIYGTGGWPCARQAIAEAMLG
ncbi:unnamed protein product [Symbiodinium natans]|uniref:Uncharacterized protein n=1 Tax=Symbiodinium natans TaxID=878477 RepID=A0A812TGE8_9DINO|nr:unnamed protein product [Symbiodinium natans]